MASGEEEKTWNFDSWADRYDKEVASDSQHYYARYDQVLDAVATLASPVPGKRVLDIRTGMGNLALRCLARGPEVIGLDPSESMLSHARSKARGASGVEFHQVDDPFLHIPYPDSCFDAVVSTYAHHHILHRLRSDSVREMVRVLTPGDRWVLGDLVFETEQAEIRALREYRWLESAYFARIDDLRGVLGELGMTLNSQQITPVTWVLWSSKG